MWEVVVDIAPRTIKGTNGCHKYVFDAYKTKREADDMAWKLRALCWDVVVAEAKVTVEENKRR